MIYRFGKAGCQVFSRWRFIKYSYRSIHYSTVCMAPNASLFLRRCFSLLPLAFATPFFLIGAIEKSRQRRSRIFPCSRTGSRSARKNDCGLAGRTFLNRPEAADMQHACGSICPWKLLLFNTPLFVPQVWSEIPEFFGFPLSGRGCRICLKGASPSYRNEGDEGQASERLDSSRF